MKKIVLLSALLAIWIVGSSFWYICKIREHCGTNLQETKLDSILEKDQSFMLVHDSTIAPLNDQKADSVRMLSEKLAELDLYFQKQSIKILQFDYASGQTSISQDDQAYFEKLAFYLKFNSDKSVEITGHSDNLGSQKGNEKYSMLRAEFVKLHLQGIGVLENQLIISAKADSEPILSNDTDAGRAKNRRVEIKLSKL